MQPAASTQATFAHFSPPRGASIYSRIGIIHAISITKQPGIIWSGSDFPCTSLRTRATQSALEENNRHHHSRRRGRVAAAGICEDEFETQRAKSDERLLLSQFPLFKVSIATERLEEGDK